jgi:hypothetical protein
MVLIKKIIYLYVCVCVCGWVVVLIRINLMINDVDYLYMCLLAICISFVSYLFGLIPISKFGSSFIINDSISTFSRHMYFSPVCGLLFIFLMLSFDEQTFCGLS